MQLSVTNGHLKKIIGEVKEFLESNEEMPHDLLTDFIGELKYSNLLLAGKTEGDDLIFENLTSDDGLSVIALYTDEDEFEKAYSDSDYQAIPNEIEYYIELVNDHEFVGILINPENEDVFIEREFLNGIPVAEISKSDDGEGYSSQKLRDIAINASNESLAEFMKSGDDHFEALMLELSKATLLCVVASDDELEEHANDGIIAVEDVSDFELCTTIDGENEYGILFTDVDAINETKGEGNFYCQLALLDDFMDFVLRSDMDGIIINPAKDDYLISRQYLIEAYGGISYNNPNFKNALDYLFVL